MKVCHARVFVRYATEPMRMLLEGLFTQWLHTTDTLLATFASSLPSTPAPSFFERNLQVSFYLTPPACLTGRSISDARAKNKPLLGLATIVESDRSV